MRVSRVILLAFAGFAVVHAHVPEEKKKWDRLGSDIPNDILAFSGDGDRVAVSDDAGEMHVYEWTDGDTWTEIAAPDAKPAFASFSSDGHLLATLSNGELSQHKWQNGVWETTLLDPSVVNCLSLALSGDGSHVAVGVSGAPLSQPSAYASVWPPVTVKRRLPSVRKDGSARTRVRTREIPNVKKRNSRYARAEIMAGEVYVYNLTDPQQVYATVLSAPSAVSEAFGSSIALSKDGYTIVVGDPPFSTISLYELDGDSTWDLKASLASVDLYDRFGEAVAVSGDGHFFAGGTSNYDNNDLGYVRVFTTDATGNIFEAARIRGYEAGDGFGISASFSYDGRILAVGSDASVQVFERLADHVWMKHEKIAGSFGGEVWVSEDGTRVAVEPQPSGNTRIYSAVQAEDPAHGTPPPTSKKDVVGDRFVVITAVLFGVGALVVAAIFVCISCTVRGGGRRSGVRKNLPGGRV